MDFLADRVTSYAFLMLLPVVFFKLARNIRLGKGTDPVSNTYLSIIYTCLFCIAFFGLYMGAGLSFLFRVRYVSVALFLLMEFAVPMLVVFSAALVIRKLRSHFQRGRVNDVGNN